MTADKRRRARARGMTGRVETAEGRCEWPGCARQAEYRAPVSPDEIDRYRWFCLDHVREYNASWNFFENYSAAAMDAQAAADRVWGRATKPLGDAAREGAGRGRQSPHANGDAWARWGFRDPMEVLGENATMNPGRPADEPRPRRRLAREEQQAMDTLGLSHEVESLREVRQRYTDLVKMLHPDMNGGQDPEPGRLDRVLKAWKILKRSRNFTDD
ncbi:MAG: J domain-containing protein [Pseudomonadota bacterium]